MRKLSTNDKKAYIQITSDTADTYINVPGNNLAAPLIQTMNQDKQLYGMPVACNYSVACYFASVIKSCQGNCVVQLEVRQKRCYVAATV